MNLEIHGVPVIIQDVDNEDSKLGGCNKSYRELRDEWIAYLTGSEAVKLKAPKIKRFEIGTLAHFWFKDGKLRFHCNKYDQTTCLERCQDGCVDWSMADMECSGDHMGKDVDEVEKSREMLLDTMHVLRVIMK